VCLCASCVDPLCGPPLWWWVLCGALPSMWVPCVGPLCVGPLCGSPAWVPCVGPLCVGPPCGSPVWVPCVGPATQCVAGCGIYRVTSPARSHAPALTMIYNCCVFLFPFSGRVRCRRKDRKCHLEVPARRPGALQMLRLTPWALQPFLVGVLSTAAAIRKLPHK